MTTDLPCKGCFSRLENHKQLHSLYFLRSDPMGGIWGYCGTITHLDWHGVGTSILLRLVLKVALEQASLMFLFGRIGYREE